MIASRNNLRCQSTGEVLTPEVLENGTSSGIVNRFLLSYLEEYF